MRGVQRRVEVTSVRNAWIIFCTIFFFDQGMKAIARTYPKWEGTFFRITENPGIAFSIPLSGMLFWIVFAGALFFCIGSAVHGIRTHNTKFLFSLGLILGGGLSNALDRFRFGAVTDIFALPGGLLFNVADMAITTGIFFLLFVIMPSNKTSLTSPKASQIS